MTSSPHPPTSEKSNLLLDFPIKLYTALRTIRLYPATSPQVQRGNDLVLHAFQALRAANPGDGSVPLAFSDGKVLVCDEQLAPSDQARPQIQGLIAMANRFSLYSFVFHSSFSAAQCAAFTQTVSLLLGDKDLVEPVATLLAKAGITTVSVDSKRYVAIQKEALDSKPGASDREQADGASGTTDQTTIPGISTALVQELIRRLPPPTIPHQHPQEVTNGVIEFLRQLAQETDHPRQATDTEQFAKVLSGLDPGLLAQLVTALPPTAEVDSVLSAALHQLTPPQLDTLIVNQIAQLTSEEGLAPDDILTQRLRGLLGERLYHQIVDQVPNELLDQTINHLAPRQINRMVAALIHGVPVGKEGGTEFKIADGALFKRLARTKKGPEITKAIAHTIDARRLLLNPSTPLDHFPEHLRQRLRQPEWSASVLVAMAQYAVDAAKKDGNTDQLASFARFLTIYDNLFDQNEQEQIASLAVTNFLLFNDQELGLLLVYTGKSFFGEQLHRQLIRHLAEDQLERLSDQDQTLRDSDHGASEVEDTKPPEGQIVEIDSLDLGQITRSSVISDKGKVDAFQGEELEIWSDLISRLTPQEFKTVAQEWSELRFKPEEIVVNQGDKNDALFFITQGSLKVSHRTGSHELFITTLNRGQIAGEHFFASFFWSVTLTSLTPSRLHVLKRSTLNAWKEQFPRLLTKLHAYYLACNPIGSMLEKKKLERRRDERFTLTRQITVQPINDHDAPIGRGFHTQTNDVSYGGLAFLVRIPHQEKARLLLGRRMQITLQVGGKHHALSIKGIIIGIKPLQVLGNDFSVHFKSDHPLDQQALQSILG
ncbi:MAG: cyclic nucleotide-binding domain-containing protein [Proteobacteria bacterium]|nr:cyclic nucleotide-binding domain-containing protein [Pseudomonadota bacterium]